MTTEQKAQAMVVEVLKERGIPGFCIVDRQTGVVEEALCRAIEQHEEDKAAHAERLLATHSIVINLDAAAAKQELADFKQEVVDGVTAYFKTGNVTNLRELILPAPKPDPLVEAMLSAWPQYADRKDACSNDADALRAALEARGLTITTIEKD